MARYFTLIGFICIGLFCVPLVCAQNITIFALGDSITQGLARDSQQRKWGTLKPLYGGIDVNWGYPIALQERTHSDLHIDLNRGKPFSAAIYNWGHGGYNSADPLNCQSNPKDCLDTVLASREADFMLILLGSNDLYKRIGHEVTIFNLREIIKKCKQQGVEPIIGTITPNTANVPFSGSDIEKFYNPGIRNLAIEENILIADHYAAMRYDWNSLTSGDGLHLGREGNQRMADTWYSALAQAEFKGVGNAAILHLLLKSE